MKQWYSPARALLCAASLWAGNAADADAQRPTVAAAAAPGGGGQPAILVDESPWSRVVDSLLLPLDKAQVPSGILYDRTLPLALLQAFDRAQADTSSAEHFRQAHLELYMSAYQRAGFRYTPSRLRQRAEAAVRRDSVPLGVLDYRFHLLDTLAVRDGLIQFQNGRYHDVAGRGRSPYEARDVVVAAPLAEAVNQSTRFYVGAPFAFGNRGRTLTQLVVDFDNGAPAVACVPGQAVLVQYPSTGPKVLHLTAYFSDGTQASTRAAVTVRAAVALRAVPLSDVKAAVGFGGYDGGASLRGVGQALAVLHNQTSLNEQSSGQAFKLRNPVVFMDGFDPLDKSRLLDAAPGDKSLLQQLNEAGITGGLAALQRDLVILNFPKGPREFTNAPGTLTAYDVDGGADYVERNAMVLVQLLNDLKPRLVPGQQYTVIGPSMGGLISRYALAYMEKMRLQDPGNPYWEHNTLTWLSFDAPHLGANVPLATQHFLNFYQNIAESSKANLEDKIQSPAARQMLVAYYNAYGAGRTPGGSTGFRDRFMRALRDNGEAGSLGYPVRVRRVALVNGRLDGALDAGLGSPCGTAFEMNAKLRFWPGVAAAVIRTFFFKSTRSNTITQSTARFAPGPNTTCAVFDGVLNAGDWGINLGTPTGGGLRSIVTAASTAAGSYDLAPGGWYDSQQQIQQQSEGGAEGKPYRINVTNVRPNHTFIPTVSALAYQYQTTAGYQNTGSLPNPYTNLLGRNLVCDRDIPFDAYYGPNSENTRHVLGLNDGMKQFLSAELTGRTTTPVFANPNAGICPGSAATVRVNDECSRRDATGAELFPVAYAWSTSDPRLQIVAGQGTAAVTLQAQPGFIGNVTVSVVATRQGWTPSAPAAQSVYVGPAQLSVGTGGDLCQGGTAVATAAPANITGPLSWSVEGQFGGSRPVTVLSPTAVSFSMGFRVQNITVTVTGTDACTGQPRQATSTVRVQNCTDAQLTLHPNPTADRVDLSVAEEGNTAARGAENDDFTATVHNGQGQPVLTGQSTAGHLMLDTQRLQPGLYHVQAVLSDGRIVRRQLSVQR